MANNSAICALYLELIGFHPTSMSDLATRQWLAVTAEFPDLLTANLHEQIKSLFIKIPELAWTIQENRQKIIFYNHEAGLILIYLLKRHRNRLLRDWPLDKSILQAVATNIGVSLDE